MKNPRVIIGDEIILKKSLHGGTSYVGRLLRVSVISGGCFSANDDQRGGSVSIYPDDEFVFENRKKLIKRLQSEIKEIQEELDFYQKYETEEDFVADKLDKILNAQGPRAIAKILKELKGSNYL